MPRQRSKKLSESHKTAEDAAPEVRHEEPRAGSDNEGSEDLEKDEEEEELDRLVLGDGSAFMAQLGLQMDVDYEERSDGESGLDEEGGSEAGLEGVDDTDVNATPPILPA